VQKETQAQTGVVRGAGAQVVWIGRTGEAGRERCGDEEGQQVIAMASAEKSIRWVVAVCVCLAVCAVSAPAYASSPWWSLSSNVRPTNLPPGGEGTIVVSAVNVGDAPTSGDVIFSDTLPAGVSAQSVTLTALAISGDLSSLGKCETAPGRVQCDWSGELPVLNPYEYLKMEIRVKAAAGAVSAGENRVEVSGGGVPGASLARPVVVSAAAVPFAAEDFSFVPEEEGGAVDARAGSHPFQVTGTLALNQTADPVSPPGLPRDVRFQLPPGFLGDATAVAQCSEADFAQLTEGTNICPADTAVGVATVTIDEPHLGFVFTVPAPLFNLVPGRGEPARFGFAVLNSPVILDTAVRAGRDYGVVAGSSNITQLAAFLSTQITLWGVPGDPRHDSSRGRACAVNGYWAAGRPCVAQDQVNPRPLLTLPTSCALPFRVGLEGDSWPLKGAPQGLMLPAREYQLTDSLGQTAGLSGCNQLPFAPSIEVSPETHAASTPTGLDVHVHLPQDSTRTAEGLGEAAIKDTTVTLPEGMALNPAGAGGLEACTETQIGFEGTGGDGTMLFSPTIGEPFCPDASKVGTVKVKIAGLPNPLEGAVYVASQNANPFGSLVALYIVASDPVSGVVAKVPAEVALDPATGRLTTTIHNIPQAPIEDIELHFFGGPRGPLATPAACGTYATTGSFLPWSETPAVDVSSSFAVTSGPGGSACHSPAPFAPTLVAGTMSPQAGAFSPFTATFSRSDADQEISGVTVRTPPGLLGILKGVERCGEPQASLGTCGANSLIGHTTVAAGAGSEPFVVQGGQVFLTGPYNGAPFGLSIVVPAVAGPFNLGNITVRAAIHVDPHTAQITVTSDPLPTIWKGIPLQVRKVNVTIDRPGFMFNPTNCEPLTVGGVLTSTQGATASVSSHFQAVNCANLPFKPRFTVSTQAKTSKKNGASLDVKVAYPKGTQANIRSVAVTLPKQLPSRLSTIQQACTEAAFAANPASCPAGSNIGAATATTPVLANPLTGPAYLVSHGGAAFPDVVIVFQGEGVTLDLVGSVNIKKSITSSTFASIPDAPISGFELNLPEGPHSGLAAVVPAKAKGNLCGQSLVMPTTITGQNGAQIKQNTKIQVTGCPKTKKKAKRKHAKRGRKK
jgi:uncharacterized repeat protein (TIGR01451 family)